MSAYGYNQQNQAYDLASDRNSQIFWDALSMTSSDRNSIALSIYHSVPELHQDENDCRNDKVRLQSFVTRPNESEM